MVSTIFFLRVFLLSILGLSISSNSFCEWDRDINALAFQISGERIIGDIESLTGFETRYALSSECNVSVEFLFDYFSSLGGYNTSLHYFKLSDELMGKNVIAKRDGMDRRGEYVILFAHYDSISDDPYNSAPGANDNACGVGVMMEVARVMNRYCWNRTLIFIAFSGEELGFLGSTAWVEDNKWIVDDIVGAVCLDGVGRGDFISIMYANADSKALADIMFNVSVKLGFNDFKVTASTLGVRGSDSSVFLGRNLRVIRLWDEDINYIHTSRDTPDTLYRIRFIETAKVVLGTLALLSIKPLDTLFTSTHRVLTFQERAKLDRNMIVLALSIVLLVSVLVWKLSKDYLIKRLDYARARVIKKGNIQESRF